jgi:sulfoxide reductase heme-binding subunit YedZ
MNEWMLAVMPDVEGVRLLIRVTARTSLLFFLLAYTAQAFWVLWPGAASRWVRQYRRQWGWLLVVSHTIHAVGIVSLAVMAPVLFQVLAPLSNRITGGLAYAFLWSMGATSFDRSAQWLGRIWWSRLHTWGSHYLWLSFMVANGKRIAHHPVYAWPTALLLLAMGLRWAAVVVQRHRSR